MSANVCPWWIGYLLASPLRRLVYDPRRMLAPWVRPGMRALDVGCAMGFFSLPMADLVGPDGRVLCVDLQERMLNSLRRRARRKGLAERIEPRLTPADDDLGLADIEGTIDFALAFAVVHETPDASAFLGQTFSALVPGGVLLLAEPRGHVSDAAFEATLAVARGVGFVPAERPAIRKSHAVLLERPRAAA
jgi:2-polyprenyl-3-methyl-5-hydroxy-6-metoxy-1,4-benzoquinol methylase